MRYNKNNRESAKNTEKESKSKTPIFHFTNCSLVPTTIKDNGIPTIRGDNVSQKRSSNKSSLSSCQCDLGYLQKLSVSLQPNTP